MVVLILVIWVDTVFLLLNTPYTTQTSWLQSRCGTGLKMQSKEASFRVADYSPVFYYLESFSPQSFVKLCRFLGTNRGSYIEGGSQKSDFYQRWNRQEPLLPLALQRRPSSDRPKQGEEQSSTSAERLTVSLLCLLCPEWRRSSI